MRDRRCSLWIMRQMRRAGDRAYVSTIVARHEAVCASCRA